MFKIISKQELAPQIKKIEVEAAAISQKSLPGQFVILIVDEFGERIPLTIARANKENKTITLIFQEVGISTKKLGKLNIGDSIKELAGPLGHPAEIYPVGGKKFGTVVCIGGGVGIAECYPVAKALKEAGNKIISILGARSKDLLILENELQQVSDKIFIATDDGSYGQKGLVTDILKQLIGAKEKIDLVYTIGPVMMMKAVCLLTCPYKIKTTVCLNSIMVDGTGMCGSCRITSGSTSKFACVDGPDFDGQTINWDELKNRLNLFKEKERQALEKYERKGKDLKS